MYRVVSNRWDFVIEDGFQTAGQAHNWGEENCGSWSCWENDWRVEYYLA